MPLSSAVAIMVAARVAIEMIIAGVTMHDSGDIHIAGNREVVLTLTEVGQDLVDIGRVEGLEVAGLQEISVHLERAIALLVDRHMVIDAGTDDLQDTVLDPHAANPG